MSITSSILDVIKSRGGQLIVVALLAMAGGAYLHAKFTVPATSTTVVNGTPQVKVESPTLSTSTIDRLVTDPKQQQAIDLLAKENNALKLKLTQVSTSTAKNQSIGGTSQGGTIQANQAAGPLSPTPLVPRAQSATNNVQGNTTISQPQSAPSNENASPKSSTFTDYQLSATYDSSSFTYKLTQDFIIESSVSSTGTGLTKLFQSTPKGLVEIPTKTTVITADPLAPRLIVSPRIQAGIGYAGAKGGVIAFQWFKRGSSPAAEDTRWAFLSPGLFITSSTTGKPVVLPVSFNLGTLKHSPFTNVWISPTVDINKSLGIVFTATF